MRAILALLLSMLMGCVCVDLFAESHGDMARDHWWLEEPVRLIQTNLREIDAIDFDVNEYVRLMEEYGANTVLINVGGIVANYTTNLDYQYRNPHLKFDIIGQVVEKLHKKGIRVIGRFDFSKINESIAAWNQDWLYIDVKGEIVNYNGQIHTCVNGQYQQEMLFNILDEAITRYPLDGIFFNMIGYQTRDYSRTYHGICQSDACRKRFVEYSGGMNLPVVEDVNDPVFRKYQAFKIETSNELFQRVNAFIKSKNRNMAICTYTHAGVDIVRKESHSSIYDERPAWEYSASHNVKSVLGSFQFKQVSNAAVHFIDYPNRHSAVSPHLTALRLVQNIMNGGGPDFYCIGRLDNQEDRATLLKVKEVFNFHKMNDRWFTNIHSRAEICLVWDGMNDSEYRGIFEMLTENHIMFDVMEYWRISDADTPRPLSDYTLAILPSINRLSDQQCFLLDRYVKGGGKLLITGATSTQDEEGNPLNRFRLSCAGISQEYTTLKAAKGTYLRIFPRDKTEFSDPGFKDLDIVYLWGDLLNVRPAKDSDKMLGYIPPAMFGPPEKCYYNEVTEIPGLIHNNYGNGSTVYFPFEIGRHYNQTRHHAHKLLVMSAMKDLLHYDQDLVTDAPPVVEISRQMANDGRFEWIGLVNHSGQIGLNFSQPVPIQNIELSFTQNRKIKEIRLLHSGGVLPPAAKSGGRRTVTVPELTSFEVVVIEYE